MKKKSILALLLALLMVFALAACGGGQDAEEEAEDQATEQAEDEGAGLVEADKGDLEDVAIKVITAAIEGDADTYVSYLDPNYLGYIGSKGVDQAALKEKLVSAAETYKKEYAELCGDDYKIEHSVYKTVVVDVQQSDPSALQEEVDSVFDIDVGLEFDIPEDDDYTMDYSNADAVARVGIDSDLEGSKGDAEMTNKWFFIEIDGKWYMAAARELNDPATD